MAGVVWALDEAGHHVSGADLVLDLRRPDRRRAVVVGGAGVRRAGRARRPGRPGDRADGAGQAGPRAENAFVGAPTGQMDQAASTLCEAGNALFLDCRSFDAEQVPLDLAAAGLELLVLDTRTPHALVDSEYAARRAACEAAAAVLGVPAPCETSPTCDAALARLDDDGDAPPGPPRGDREPAGAGRGRARSAPGTPGLAPLLDAVARLDAGRLRDHRARPSTWP